MLLPNVTMNVSGVSKSLGKMKWSKGSQGKCTCDVHLQRAETWDDRTSLSNLPWQEVTCILTFFLVAGLLLPLCRPRLEQLLCFVQHRTRLWERLRCSVSSNHVPNCIHHIWLILGGVSRCDKISNELVHLHPGALTLLRPVQNVSLSSYVRAAECSKQTVSGF